MERVFTYACHFFKQRAESEVQCIFVSSTADIHEWAGVPTKTAAELRNFQRPEVKGHADEISEFFERHPENISPSSIVVGFRKPVECLDEHNKPLDVKNLQTSTAIAGKIRIRAFVLDPVATISKKRESLAQIIKQYLEDNREFDTPDTYPLESASQNANEQIKLSDEIDPEASLVAHDDDPEGDSLMEEDVDQPTSTSNVDSRTLLIRALKKIDTEELPEPEVDGWLGTLIDMRKPGLIIDGQHRVRGTRNRKVLFSVAALPTADWPELAFQFIVLNMAAKKVQDSLLINIVGNSLNALELGKIDQRLSDSGIPVPLYQGVMRIHDDENSPFFGKLRFGIGQESGIIEAASAKTKIVNFWFSAKELYPLVKHLLPGKTKAEKLTHWQTTGMWYEYLCAFWGAAKEFYSANSSLWKNDLEPDSKVPLSKLMRVTIINLTQIAMIRYMRNALKSRIDNDLDGSQSMLTLLPDVVKFKEYSTLYFKRLKPEFFQDWGPSAKGLDGSVAIKNAYIDAVVEVISNNKSIPKLKTDGENLIFKDAKK